MKTSPIQTIATQKHYLLPLLMPAFVYVMLFCSLPVRSVSGAILFTIIFGFYPDSFRSGSRSLMPAFCLTAFVWLCAAVVIVMSFVGAIE